jgi:hypothetical protein
VCRQDNGRRATVRGDQLPDCSATEWIKTRRDLIQQQQVRSTCKGTSQLELALLAPAEILREERDLWCEVTPGQEIQVRFRLTMVFRRLDRSP